MKSGKVNSVSEEMAMIIQATEHPRAADALLLFSA